VGDLEAIAPALGDALSFHEPVPVDGVPVGATLTPADARQLGTALVSLGEARCAAIPRGAGTQLGFGNAPVALTKLMLPRMIEQKGGHLIVTSSIAGKQAVPHHSTYCAAKHALHGYFDTLRVEHLKDNIQVTLLVIAGVKSNVFLHALKGDGSEYGPSNWGGGNGIPAEKCAEQVVDGMLKGEHELVIGLESALRGLRQREQDPRGFVKRMSDTMQWMNKS
jgi:NAD(P)-dependent dehydrogenase (short-subunit alcohol dehydrogenase family)